MTQERELLDPLKYLLGRRIKKIQIQTLIEKKGESCVKEIKFYTKALDPKIDIPQHYRDNLTSKKIGKKFYATQILGVKLTGGAKTTLLNLDFLPINDNIILGITTTEIKTNENILERPSKYWTDRTIINNYRDRTLASNFSKSTTYSFALGMYEDCDEYGQSYTFNISYNNASEEIKRDIRVVCETGGEWSFILKKTSPVLC